MNNRGRTVYIAGAGIAGLTLALALAKFGATVIVLERNETIQEFGAGVQISPNARRVLNQLGLDRQIAAKSFEPQGIDVYPLESVRPLVTLALGEAISKRYGVPYAVMHRADLAEALHRACRRFANIDVIFGVQSFDVVSHARGISISIDEGAGKTRNSRGFAFVGADGVNSQTRTEIMGGPKADYQNRVAWRALIDIEALGTMFMLDRTSLLWGPGSHAVCYPLAHRNKLNVALFAKEKPGRAFGATPPRRPTLPPAMSANPRFAALMRAADDSWGYWPLATVSTDHWHHGGIGLVGDAAHAMVPFQAQGAAMAIEDAAILAPLLMTEPDAGSAFDRFVGLRRARVERVAAVSAANGRAFHMKWPLSAARNTIVALQGQTGHLSRLDWLYGYDAAPEVDTIPSSKSASP